MRPQRHPNREDVTISFCAHTKEALTSVPTITPQRLMARVEPHGVVVAARKEMPAIGRKSGCVNRCRVQADMRDESPFADIP